MTNSVWITRTEPAERSAEAWALAGFEPVIAPLLKVHPMDWDCISPDEAQLVFTSAQGVRHCGLMGDGRRVYTVGNATAEVAREAGFTDVVSAKGDWRSLVEIIEPTDAAILHISGETVRGRIVETLRERGFSAKRHIVYRTEAVTDWPIDLESVDAIALYSPKAAETLMALPRRNLAHLTAYCLSENVASPLSDLEFKIAAEPTERALIACSQSPDR